jgi:hypothetical protein
VRLFLPSRYNFTDLGKPVGLAVFFIFGTQADILAALKFWEKKESTPSVPWADRDEKASIRSFQLDVKKGDAVSVISTPSEAFARQGRV